MSGGSWKPGQERGEGDGAGIVAGVLVIAGGQPAPLLELAEAAFDAVVARVAGGIEAGWAPAGRAAASAVGGLVGLPRNGVRDTAGAQ